MLASVSNGLGMAENGRKSRQNWAPNLPGELSSRHRRAVGDRSGQQGLVVVNLRRGWTILARAGQASDRGLLFPQLCSTGSRGISFFPGFAPPALSPYAPLIPMLLVKRRRRRSVVAGEEGCSCNRSPVPVFPGSIGGIL